MRSMMLFAALAFVAVAAGQDFNSIHSLILPPAGVMHHQVRTRYRRVMSSWLRKPSQASNGPAVFPVSYGADPTGETDSTAAFQAMMKDVLSRDAAGNKLAENITDLGGVTVDLQGGVYLISTPLVVPANYGNLRFTAGTLRANSTGWGSSSSYLIEVGGSCSNGQHSCNMNIGFDHLLFDGSHVAAGSVKVTATMGTVIGPLTYHTGFVKAGVDIEGGHETVIDGSWFGAYFWGDPRKENATLLQDNAGILINGNDHFVTDTIVFSSSIGVLLNGEANLLTGVHCWNDATGNGGRGVVTTVSQNRFESIYMDFTDFTAVDPTATVVADSFFLGGGRVELVPGSKAVVNGLDLRDNVFWDAYGIPDGKTVIVSTTSPWSSGKPFSSVTDATIAGTLVQPGGSFKPLSTRVTRTVKVTSSTSSTSIDFTPHMPFTAAEAPLQSVMAFVSADKGFPVAVARFDSSSLTVTVETSEPFTGSVTVTADQSMRTVDL